MYEVKLEENAECQKKILLSNILSIALELFLSKTEISENCHLLNTLCSALADVYQTSQNSLQPIINSFKLLV